MVILIIQFVSVIILWCYTTITYATNSQNDRICSIQGDQIFKTILTYQKYKYRNNFFHMVHYGANTKRSLFSAWINYPATGHPISEIHYSPKQCNLSISLTCTLFSECSFFKEIRYFVSTVHEVVIPYGLYHTHIYSRSHVQQNIHSIVITATLMPCYQQCTLITQQSISNISKNC